MNYQKAAELVGEPRLSRRALKSFIRHCKMDAIDMWICCGKESVLFEDRDEKYSKNLVVGGLNYDHLVEVRRLIRHESLAKGTK